MKRFTITHLFLLVTWCGIGFFAARPYFATRPYLGDIGDSAGTWAQGHATDATYLAILGDDIVAASPRWHPFDSNPPISARTALAIADRHRKQMLDASSDTNGDP